MWRPAGIALVLLALAIGSIFWPAAAPSTLRDRVATVPVEPERTLTIAAFGSSLTRRALWPGRLKDALAACGIGAAPAIVIAQAGAGSPEGADLIGTAPGPFDVVLLEFAINDADLIDGVPRAVSRSNHRRMISALRSRDPEVAIILIATNPVSGVQKLKRPKLMAYYDDYALLAEEADTGFFDGTARWIAADPGPEAVPDGLHPVPAVEADLYTVPIRDLIAGTLGRDCKEP